MKLNEKILIAGEGGQGIQTIAKILIEAISLSGKEVCYIPSFGVEQRGTPSVSFITISDHEIYYPRFSEADYVIILQRRAINAVAEYITPNTKVIFDSSTVTACDLPKTAVHIFGTPATKYANEKFTPKAFNMIILGKITKLLNLKEDAILKSIDDNLGKKFKDPKIRQANLEAFEFGRDVVFEVKDFTAPCFVPSDQNIIRKGFDKKAEVVPMRCKGCGLCVEKCPVGALSFCDTLGVFATPVPEVDLEKCIACGNCFKFCPDGAIKVEKNVKK